MQNILTFIGLRYSIRCNLKFDLIGIVVSDKIKDIMKENVDKINSVIDVNTVVGSPIKINDKVTIIPVSKISYGFGTGGADFQNKSNPNDPFFGGACGTGVSMSPVGFLTVCDENVTFLQVESFSGALDRLIAMAPDIVNKISNSIKNRKKDKKDS